MVTFWLISTSDVGLLGNVNNSCVLRKYRLYHHALHGGLFDVVVGSQDTLPIYIFGDKGYPLFYWFMIPNKKNKQHHSILKIKKKGFTGQKCIFIMK
jgi:hypothetical protein